MTSADTLIRVLCLLAALLGDDKLTQPYCDAPGPSSSSSSSAATSSLVSSSAHSSSVSSSPVSSSLVSSSVHSSSLLSSSAVSSSSSSSSGGATPGAVLVNWFPLSTTYVDTVTGSSSEISFVGGAGCAQFLPPFAGAGYTAWTQACPIDMNPVSLQLAAPPVTSGDYSQCVYVFPTFFSEAGGGRTYFFGCGGFAGDDVDCLTTAYLAEYGVFLIAITGAEGGGDGLTPPTIPTNRWIHVCLTWQAASSLLTAYLNGAVAGTYVATSLGTPYQAPQLGPNGVNASFVNWRTWSGAINASQAAYYAAIDAPPGNPSTSSSSSATPRSSSSSLSLVTSGPTSAAGSSTSSNIDTGADYCLTFGTSDSFACMQALLSVPGVYEVPVPNFVYYMTYQAGGSQSPLIIGPDVQFYGNNCSFVNIQVSPYGYDPTFGWYECGPSSSPIHCPPYQSSDFGWYSYMVYMESNTVISNVTIISSIPAQGLQVDYEASNVLVEYTRFPFLAALFENATNPYVESADAYASVKRAAINFGGHNNNIELSHNYCFEVGYCIILDAFFISNVYIHDNVILNITADGICMNSPAFGNENGQINPDTGQIFVDYYDVPYAISNVWIENNVIHYTGYQRYTPSSPWIFNVDQSFGFGTSCAGCMNVTIINNDYFHNLWQNVHLESNSFWINVINNTMNWVDNNGAIGEWFGEENNLWMGGNVYQILVQGNTFMNANDTAISLITVPTGYCITRSGVNSVVPCVPIPAAVWFSAYVNITGNNFSSYGKAGGPQSGAMKVGGYFQQQAHINITGNVYNSAQWACNSQVGDTNKFIDCNCQGDPTLVISETNVGFCTSPTSGITSVGPLTSCSGYNWGAGACALSESTSVAPSAWWTIVTLPPAQPQPVSAAQSLPFNPVTFDILSAPLPSWTDIAGSGYVLLASSVLPNYAPGIDADNGVPGALFLPNTNALSTSSAVWPTHSDYTIVLTLDMYSNANSIILGSVGGGFIGGLMVNKVNERALRLFVVLIGLALTVGLFLRAA